MTAPRDHYRPPVSGLLSAIGGLLSLIACHQATYHPVNAFGPLTHHDAALSYQAARCQEIFEYAATSDGFNPGQIELLSWNLPKDQHVDWKKNFTAFAADRDAVLMQEAKLIGVTTPISDTTPFSPGYRCGGYITGAMTLNRAAPSAVCNFIAVESWPQSPAAINITEFRLDNHLNSQLATLCLANQQ